MIENSNHNHLEILEIIDNKNILNKSYEEEIIENIN